MNNEKENDTKKSTFNKKRDISILVEKCKKILAGTTGLRVHELEGELIRKTVILAYEYYLEGISIREYDEKYQAICETVLEGHFNYYYALISFYLNTHFWLPQVVYNIIVKAEEI